ncbi:hypothetical protein DCO58_07075 [Helicobacter saguini]|uniref:Porin n=1 Tax=Helicobacter saguini TaxID=1548018 RepID=A0A347VN47_9HELI|nr:hypothetical protein [Helicobacter saguini]MWV61905.1 hypothetical protein [Helicobacter saguini]MWV67420.1 hypothetical protein [Helicobacter saguini]MWV69773.1 hypothetical protein [Helicobacter saguini]MWV73010.1 hypothetical protein [Helicobacter saguini]TLD95612.1 hypothetical protein LS64_001800 [Helicobacter saguini]
MKSVKKVVLSSVAVGLLISQLQGIEVYKDEEKKTSIDVYGSIRAYVGEGTNLGNGVAGSFDSHFIMGLQTSSRLGVTAKIGNISAAVEFGAGEPTFASGNTVPGLRQLWGQYNFGKAGKILIGKKDTQSLAKGFSSDIFDNDNGATGFGSMRTSNRQFQIEYTLGNLAVGLIKDSLSYDVSGAKYGLIPRIAASYGGKIGGSEYKVAGSIKIIQGGENGFRNWAFGGHLMGGYKMHLMDKKLYISAQVHGGVNGNTYGEQRINRNTGGYNFANSQISISGSNVVIVGALAEAGYKLGSLGTLIGAVGYQFASVSDLNRTFNSFSVMAQLPMKFGKFTLTPQVSYYGTGATRTQDSGNGLMAFVQARFDF